MVQGALAVRNVLEIGMRFVDRSLSPPRVHQVFPAELEDHLSVADDVCIDICECIGGDFERNDPPRGFP